MNAPLRLLTVDQVAEILQVSRASVYRWAESGALPAVRLGRAVRFHPEAVEELIRRGLNGMERPAS